MSAKVLNFKAKSQPETAEPQTTIARLEAADHLEVGQLISYYDQANPRQTAVVVTLPNAHGMQNAIFVDDYHFAQVRKGGVNYQHLLEGRAPFAGWSLVAGMVDANMVAGLVAANEALAQQRRESEANRQAQREEAIARGQQVLGQLMPEGTKAVIVGIREEDVSDTQTDYFATRDGQTIILGFSAHTRDIFSEMRKAAANAPETAHLATAEPKFEHREKWSMGAGYYLKASGRYSNGWKVEKWSLGYHDKDVAAIAGTEGGLRIPVKTAEPVKSASKKVASAPATGEKSAAAKAWDTRRAKLAAQA